MKSGKIDLKKRDFVYDGRKPEEDKEKGYSFMPLSYMDSKLMNSVTCRHLAKRIQEKGATYSHITTYAVSPGFCRSSLGRNVHLPLYRKVLAVPIMLLIQRTSIQGAQNIIFATLEDKSQLKSGHVYCDGKEVEVLGAIGEAAGEV
eukprot:13201841-Ditylum_brightwellii.AAC.1